MQITVHGTPTPLLGKEQSTGKEAPAARITRIDGTQNVIGMIAPTLQLFIVMPSLKTEVCSLGAKRFNTLLASKPKVKATMVTTDALEFVQGYMTQEGIEHLDVVIDHDRNFGKKYGVLIGEGKLKDKLARALFLIDREGQIVYREIVGEIVDEVDYDACIAAIDAQLAIKKKGHTHEDWMSV